ncbi:MAG: tRNA uridine-5-carboxymethylaminomethyl(34) synthesis GTPase MnmE, partial [Bacteroidota bacterium]
MTEHSFHTIICAVATPGRGALSLIRISGKDSLRLVSELFRPARDNASWQEKKGHSLHYGYIMDGDETIDEVMLSLFREPHSYTGEDSAEISCHGSVYIEQKIMGLLIGRGAVPARPGEFTQRAFLNGRMDLSQAEAVADLIASETEGAHRVAMNQLRGGFSKEISQLRERMLHFSSMIELELDFSEEDVEFADRQALLKLAEEARQLVDRLAASFKAGNAIKNGVPVAIVGPPNVGKSTLLNALLNEDRAIVSEIAGTTRDSIEDTIIIEGVLFRFIDTAGIRDTADTVESLGIERTYRKIAQASVVLLMAEAGDEPEKISTALKEISLQPGLDEKPLILVLNKLDRIRADDLQKTITALDLPEKVAIVSISAARGENMGELTGQLLRAVNLGPVRHQDVIITNIRHFHALTAASTCLTRVVEGIDSRLPSDLLAQDIREAVMILGEITGEV